MQATPIHGKMHKHGTHMLGSVAKANKVLQANSLRQHPIHSWCATFSGGRHALSVKPGLSGTPGVPYTDSSRP